MCLQNTEIRIFKKILTNAGEHKTNAWSCVPCSRIKEKPGFTFWNHVYKFPAILLTRFFLEKVVIARFCLQWAALIWKILSVKSYYMQDIVCNKQLLLERFYL